MKHICHNVSSTQSWMWADKLQNQMYKPRNNLFIVNQQYCNSATAWNTWSQEWIGLVLIKWTLDGSYSISAPSTSQNIQTSIPPTRWSRALALLCNTSLGTKPTGHVHKWKRPLPHTVPYTGWPKLNDTTHHPTSHIFACNNWINLQKFIIFGTYKLQKQQMRRC